MSSTDYQEAGHQGAVDNSPAPRSNGPAPKARQTVLVRLMEQRQLVDPFRFTVYAQPSGAELSPVA